jgi:hypothetical protein
MSTVNPVKPVKVGEPITARGTNAHRMATITRVTTGPGLTFTQIGSSVVISLDTTGIPTQKGAIPYRVMSVGDNHLVCQLWDFETLTADGTDVKIAKPYLLRLSPFDGTTQQGITYAYTDGASRNADDATNDEDQVIVPAYDIVDDNIIWASVAVTGVKVAGETLTLKDDNDDGRAWAKDSG